MKSFKSEVRKAATEWLAMAVLGGESLKAQATVSTLRTHNISWVGATAQAMSTKNKLWITGWSDIVTTEEEFPATLEIAMQGHEEGKLFDTDWKSSVPEFAPMEVDEHEPISEAECPDESSAFDPFGACEDPHAEVKEADAAVKPAPRETEVLKQMDPLHDFPHRVRPGVWRRETLRSALAAWRFLFFPHKCCDDSVKEKYCTVLFVPLHCSNSSNHGCVRFVFPFLPCVQVL